MADLGMTSATIHNKVQAVWDWADDDATEQAEALMHMNNAYQRIVEGLHPQTGIPHLWSWLRAAGTISLVDGTNTYDLAADFDGMFPGETPWYSSVSGIDFPTMKEISIHRWNELREPEGSSDETEPEFYCIFPNTTFTASTGQRWVMGVYHTPDEARTLNYSYKVLVTALADDANYPRGGPKIGLLVYYGALAEMEKKDGTFDGPWEGTFQRYMATTIESDSAYLDYTSPDENHLTEAEVFGWH